MNVNIVWLIPTRDGKVSSRVLRAEFLDYYNEKH